MGTSVVAGREKHPECLACHPRKEIQDQQQKLAPGVKTNTAEGNNNKTNQDRKNNFSEKRSMFRASQNFSNHISVKRN